MDTPQEPTLPSSLLFKFPKINYTLQTRGDGRDSFRMSFDKQTFGICSILSLAWCALVLSYAVGLFSTIATTQHIASYVYVSLLMIIVFPIVLIWCGFFVYNFALHAHKSSVAILDSARILGSPALVASEDVKTLSLAVGHELNILRSSMRDIEDQMNGISKKIESEIGTLNESGARLHKTLSDVSGTIRAERDVIVDLMKIVKTENQNAKVSMAQKKETQIEVSETPEISGNVIEEKPLIRQTDIQQSYRDYQETSPMQEACQVDEQNKKTIPQAEIPRFLQASTKQENTEETLSFVDKFSAFKVPEAEPKVMPIPEQFIPNNSSYAPAYHIKPEAVILRRERQLYEGVCALAVDLNKEVGIALPQDLWSRYMRGERHVFAEHFYYKVSQDFSLYHDKMDSEAMRRLSNQFIARFETLRERLFDEPDVAVSEYLENSGIGKVYGLLSVEYV